MLKLEPQVQLLQASPSRVPYRSDASLDELPLSQQVRQDVQHPEPPRGQLREHALQYRVLRQSSLEQQAPRHQ